MDDKRWLPLDSRLKAKADEALLEFRGLYESLGDEEKQILKEWLRTIAPFQRPPVSNLIGKLNVKLQFTLREDFFKSSELEPMSMLRAIECWDRDECYTPTGLEELGL